MKRQLVIIIMAFSLLSSALASALEPAVHSFNMQAGEDFVMQLTLNQCADNPQPVTPDKCKLWVPQNLTGYSYTAPFKAAAGPTAQVFANYSSIIVNAASGRLDLRLSRAQTSRLNGKQGVWLLQQTDPAGRISYIIVGNTMSVNR